MCLYTKDSVPKIAEQDIVCYKVLLHVGQYHFSPYYNKNYTDGKELTSNLFGAFSGGEYLEVSVGLHTYKDIESIKAEGISFYKMFPKVKKSYAICVIPKGTKYYEGPINPSLIANCITYASAQLNVIKIFPSWIPMRLGRLYLKMKGQIA